jgi:aerobic C4-dicarboxylate transport protein
MTLARPFRPLYIQVLLGMGLGMTVGHFWPQVGVSLKPLSDAFVALVRMMIAPIVFCTIVIGITSLASGSKIGRTILKALALFYLLTIVARLWCK